MTATPFIPSTSGKFQKVYSEDVPFISIIYEESSTLKYVCKALPGTGSAEPYWQIKRIQTVGSATNVTFAQSDSGFNYKASFMDTYGYG